jgi:ATP-dependent Clp protease ATP-binding subunit ClpB
MSADSPLGRRFMVRSWGRRLDPARKSAASRDFEAELRRKVVGQDEAVQAVVDLYQVFRAGLNSPGRPVGNLLFLGPTGAG